MQRWDEERLKTTAARWVPEVRYFDVVDSTNRVAEQWAAEGAEDFSLVLADHQTAGRGRFDRTWFDEQGTSLLFSLVLVPRGSSEDFGLITLGAAVALVEAIREVSGGAIAPKVKWPNDVMAGGRKVAGILASARTGMAGASVVLGVGVNVATRAFPDDIAGIAGRLMPASDAATGRLELLAGFLSRFHQLWGRFPDGVVQSYRRVCETLGKNVVVSAGKETLSGRAVAVDESGRLVLDTGRAISSGEVLSVRE